MVQQTETVETDGMWADHAATDSERHRQDEQNYATMQCDEPPDAEQQTADDGPTEEPELDEDTLDNLRHIYWWR